MPGVRPQTDTNAVLTRPQSPEVSPKMKRKKRGADPDDIGEHGEEPRSSKRSACHLWPDPDQGSVVEDTIGDMPSTTSAISHLFAPHIDNDDLDGEFELPLPCKHNIALPMSYTNVDKNKLQLLAVARMWRPRLDEPKHAELACLMVLNTLRLLQHR
uniref:Uncharacterized protein n=1 Tax=Haptolina brevifila TaxID=156173 RepID=A0A7S2G2Z7_9EUKA|eukprot:CAMPEP_0174719228 /NCGR_PEP_ID=MMETSP1094-20130205/30860_1 /TAXON_ID=156173 /ORGANISM="Chrysochromulina brevifilum, Strain UTEX LB 985" /LENGTH=156 /DNA_ID=CAMNT_0015919499 /DNA_START=47 /DNA_END=517 /DNA_ORIENTATION=-